MKSHPGNLLVAFLILLAGCKKSVPPLLPVPEPKFCWQLIDAFGNHLQEVCDRTESEMRALHSDSCSYFKNVGEKLCWLADSTFLPEMTASEVELYKRCFQPNSSVAVKVDCNYYQKWYHREKRTYKPANTITYSVVRVERFCGDTATKLYQGRQIILRETTDSLIVLQFSNNGSNW